MWGSGARIIATSVSLLVLFHALQLGPAGLAVHAGQSDMRLAGPTNDHPGAAVAAAIPVVLPQPAIIPAPDQRQVPSGANTAPLAEPDTTGSASSAPPDGAVTREGSRDREDEPLGPEIAAALRARLEARSGPALQAPVASRTRKEREAIAAFYTGRDFAPLWFSRGRPIDAVKPVIARLGQAADDGLDLAGFPLPSTNVATAEAIASADIALTDAVVAYGRQASGSRVDPSMISRLIGTRPEVADAAVVLAIVATAGERAGEALRSFNPPDARYAALRDKLAELRHRHVPAAQTSNIPVGPVLRVGMHDPRVPLVRARLSLDESGAELVDSVYDMKVAAAVASFQKANGLPGSGLLTTQTVAALSGSRPSRLEGEILANMERWRWLPRDLGASRVEVNIPDFEAVVIENGSVVQRNRVVVGKEETPTPIFSEQMRYLIVNPYWNVPPSIIRNELSSDTGSLHKRGYEAFYRNGQLVVRQPPGERNALGRIKFMFPNAYSVYMHDTPLHALFDETRRAYSHGCVRVDDPFRFAETVLGSGWTESRLKKLIGDKERYVFLPKPLPVHIQYFTAFVDAAGQLQTREDIYGYSRRVRAALGLEG